MRALDQLKSAVSMKPQRKSIELPNGAEFEYWMTPLTLAERARAQKQAKSDDATEFALQLLVAKAKDENGQPMFAPGQIADLRNRLPASLVEALMLQMLADAPKDDEDEELDMKSDEGTAAKRSRAAR